MALEVIVTIEIKNQAYEGGVKDSDVLSESGKASVAPGNFKDSGRETLDLLIESAITNAQANLYKKLDAIKGEPTKKGKQ